MRIVNFNRRTKNSSYDWLNTWIDWNQVYCQDLNNKINSLYQYLLWKDPEYIIFNSPVQTTSNSSFQPFKSLISTIEEPRLIVPYEQKIKINETQSKSIFFPSRLNYHQGFYNHSDDGDGLLCYMIWDRFYCTYQHKIQDGYKYWLIEPQSGIWPEYIEFDFEWELLDFVFLFNENYVKKDEIDYYFQKKDSKLYLKVASINNLNVNSIYLLKLSSNLKNKEFYYCNINEEIAVFYKAWVIPSKHAAEISFSQDNYIVCNNSQELLPLNLIGSGGDYDKWCYYLINNTEENCFVFSTIPEEKITYDFLAGYLCMLNKQPIGDNIETNLAKQDINNFLLIPIGNGGYYDIYWNNQDLNAFYYANELGNFANQFSINLAQNCRYFNPNVDFYDFSNEIRSINISNWNTAKTTPTPNLTDHHDNIWTGQESLVGKPCFNGEQVFYDIKYSIDSTVAKNKKIHYFNATLPQSISLLSQLWLY